MSTIELNGKEYVLSKIVKPSKYRIKVGDGYVLPYLRVNQTRYSITHCCKDHGSILVSKPTLLSMIDVVEKQYGSRGIIIEQVN